jgi:hypothetical protein
LFNDVFPALHNVASRGMLNSPNLLPSDESAMRVFQFGKMPSLFLNLHVSAVCPPSSFFV